VYGAGIEDMLHRIPSVDKIKDAIGWEPSFDLEQILSDVIRHARTAAPATSGSAAAAAG
jgi:nucleoside-diphosphate-sugar epimerase